MIDIDQFEERAAVLEFDEGMKRFAAETEAAKRQGFERWEIVNVIRNRNTARGWDHGQTPARQSADNVSRVQPHQKKEG